MNPLAQIACWIVIAALAFVLCGAMILGFFLTAFDDDLPSLICLVPLVAIWSATTLASWSAYFRERRQAIAR